MIDTRRKSNAQEKRVAKELRGKVTPASGALWGQKADVRNDQFLVECKTTQKDFYLLNYSTWAKINHEALNDGYREPIMCIDLLDGKQRLAILDYNLNYDYVAYLCEQDRDTHIDKVTTDKSSRKIKYSSSTWHLVFLNKRFLSGGVHRDIELLVTPWELVCEYLEVLDREER